MRGSLGMASARGAGGGADGGRSRLGAPRAGCSGSARGTSVALSRARETPRQDGRNRNNRGRGDRVRPWAAPARGAPRRGRSGRGRIRLARRRPGGGGVTEEVAELVIVGIADVDPVPLASPLEAIDPDAADEHTGPCRSSASASRSAARTCPDSTQRGEPGVTPRASAGPPAARRAPRRRRRASRRARALTMVAPRAQLRDVRRSGGAARPCQGGGHPPAPFVEKTSPSAEHGESQLSFSVVLGRRFQRRLGPGIAGRGLVVRHRDRRRVRDARDLPARRGRLARDHVPERPSGRPVRIRPDWACELLSRSNAKRDLVDKLKVLHRNGVPYYWIADPLEQTLVHRWEPAGSI